MMSWTTDDGEHEGYAVPEFGDGVRGIGVMTHGVPDTEVIVEMTYRDGVVDPQVRTRPAAKVIAWRVVCNCTTGTGGHIETVVDGPLTRVPSATLEDLAQRKIFATDDDVPDVAYRDDVGHLIYTIWWTQHAVIHARLSQLTRAAATETTARKTTNDLARQARADGRTWEQIGGAVGITRQSAQQRWGRPSAED